MTDRYYLAVVQQLWLNDSGHGATFHTDGRRYLDRSEALRVTENELGHDDFNIATVDDGRIVAFGFGMNDFGDGEDGPHGGYDLAEIGRQIGVGVAS